VFARWSNGAVGAWHTSTGGLTGTTHLSFNARLLPNGKLARD
jgi:hypothetical protein